MLVFILVSIAIDRNVALFCKYSKMFDMILKGISFFIYMFDCVIESGSK